MGSPSKELKLSDLTPAQQDFLKQFVMGVLNCSIFTSAQIPNRGDLGMVFFPVAFGALNPQIEDLPPRPQPPNPEWEAQGYKVTYTQAEYERDLAEHDRICDEAMQKSWSRVGVLWEYWDQALPRSINGLPCFISMNIMSPEMWQLAYKLIKAEEKRRADLSLDQMLGDQNDQ